MKIFLNGKETFTDAQTIAELDRTDGCVITANGFCVTGSRPLKHGDSIYIIPKNAMPSEDELEAMMSARHTPGVHAALKRGSVAVAGLGGLGSNISIALARIGVGRLLLVDFDTVEPSNLNRQSYYIRHLGMNKTDALLEQLREINPYISIETRCARVTEDNICELFKGYDVVCEAFDNPDAKAMLVNGVLENLPGTYMVSGSGMAGYGDSDLIKTRRVMRHLYVCGDGESAACEGRGLMAPRVLVCAGHQANKILQLLVEKYSEKEI